MVEQGALASAGTAIDLALTLGQRRYAFEIKYAAAPKPARGFWQALGDLAIERAWVVAPVERSYPLAANVSAIALAELTEVMNGLQP